MTNTIITFRNMDHSDAIEAHIRKRIEELERFHPDIIGCEVVVNAPQKPQHAGREFEISLNVKIRGNDVHASRSIGRSTPTEDVNVAIHETFDAARRELQGVREKETAQEKKRQAPVLTGNGEVVRLLADDGFGFIRDDNDEEVYFAQKALGASDWRKLSVGQRVHYRCKEGEQGLYATHVELVS